MVHTHMPKPMYEEGDVTVLWNQAVHTDREVTANRPDIIIKSKKEKTCTLIFIIIIIITTGYDSASPGTSSISEVSEECSAFIFSVLRSYLKSRSLTVKALHSFKNVVNRMPSDAES